MPKRPPGNPDYDGVRNREADEEEVGGDYEDLTVAELREIAKELGVESYYELRKDDLIAAVEEAVS